jgi:glycosyltransferase EpsF
MDKIKVINFVPGLGTGGIGILMREWYKRKPDNIVFDIATIGKGLSRDELVLQGCTIYDFEAIRNVGVLQYIKNAYKIIKNGNYDIVHSHVGLLSCLIFIAARLANSRRLILHAHGTKYNQDDGSILNSVLILFLKQLSVLFATDYLACSKAASQYLFGNRIASSKAVVIENGIDLTRFKYKKSKQKKRKVVGYVARFEKNKNHGFLLKVLSKMRGFGLDVELLLIGAGDTEEVVNLAKEQGVDDYIRILPPQVDIENYYHEMDIFAFPSLFEGLGIVAIEAQACGLPIILSPGIPSEAIVSSLAIQVELNEDLWASKIDEMLRLVKKRDVHQEIINNGYDINTSSKKLMNFYARGKLS